MKVIKSIVASSPKRNISALCRSLGRCRGTFYYRPVPPRDESVLIGKISQIYKENRECFSAIKVKKSLLVEYNEVVSYKRILRIMKTEKMKHKWIRNRRKPKLPVLTSEQVSTAPCVNLVNNVNKKRKVKEVCATDVMYIYINYVRYCLNLIVDYCGSKIIGYAVSRHHDAKLVQNSLYSIKGSLFDIDILHADQGSENKNKLIDGITKVFEIRRSYSAKGTPTDNPVCESLNNIIRIEFLKGAKFNDLEDFKRQLKDYIKWYNEKRWHGSYGYNTPNQWQEEFKKSA